MWRAGQLATAATSEPQPAQPTVQGQKLERIAPRETDYQIPLMAALMLFFVAGSLYLLAWSVRTPATVASLAGSPCSVAT
jgi:hypothetical protein